MPKTRKSYTAHFKLKVIKLAEEQGNRSASREFNVDEKNIRRWRREKTVLMVMKEHKRARRYGKCLWPELEKDLKKWVLNQRVEKRRVSTLGIRLKAIEMANEKNIEGFKGGKSWCNLFMKRSGLSVRTVTSLGPDLPEDWEEKVTAFHHFVNSVKDGVNFEHFGNMDEVACTFDAPDAKTVDTKGTQNVPLTTTGAEKCSFTVILCVTADGGKCDPMVIFKRKTIPREEFPKGIVVAANEKGWINDEMMCQWIEKVWRRRKNSFFNPKSLLILDAHKAHKTERVKKEIQKLSQLAIIPGRMTKKLQPLDLSVNKSFKSKMREKWEKWMVDGIHSFTKSGKMRRASYSTVCNWIVKSWSEITPECIKNGFRKAGLCDYNDLNLNESDDTIIYGDYNSDDEASIIENLEPEQNAIINQFAEILESFNVESDEDFDGF